MDGLGNLASWMSGGSWLFRRMGRNVVCHMMAIVWLVALIELILLVASPVKSVVADCLDKLLGACVV